MVYQMDDKNRLYSKIEIDSNSGCWNFVGSLTHNGYGLLMSINKKVTTAHRVSYLLHFGEIPADMHVLHKCDNRRCVNPDHLFLGTNSDNVRDKVSKNRQSRMFGERNPAAKLTQKQALDIRKSTLSTTSLMDIYAIDRTVINNIRSGRTWRHICP